MKTVMKTFMIGENSRILSALQTPLPRLLDSRREAFGWWKGS
jgi:hypothetical protein